MDDVVGIMVVKVRGVIDFKECGNYILNNIGKKKDRKKSKMKMVLILLSIFIIIFLVLFKIILDIVLMIFFG